MKLKEFITSLILFFLVVVIFFHKTFLFGRISFPGDLAVSEFNPWKSYSYLGFLPSTVPNKAQYGDVIRQIYPWKGFSLSSLKNGSFPLWNPYNFSGQPLWANAQATVLYPLNIFYFIFSKAFSWQISIIMQTFLTSIFTYLFVRKIGVGRIGSFFSSVTFSYSLFLSVFLEYNTIDHVIIFLPLTLYAIELLIEKINFKRIAIFPLSVVLAFSAGHLQVFGFVLIFSALYCFLRIIFSNWRRKRKRYYLLGFFIFYLLSLGICSVKIFPIFELIRLSARSAQEYKFLIENLLLQTRELIVFFSPDFFGNPATRNYFLSSSYPTKAVYIGLMPIIFALFSFKLFKEKIFVKFFIFSSLLLIFLLVRSPLTQFLYSFNIPLFSTGSPSNAIFLLSFSLSVLAGFGLEFWLSKNSKSFYLIVYFLLALFSLIWFKTIIYHDIIFNKRNFAYSSLLLLIFIFLFSFGNFFKRRKVFVSFLIIVFTIFDLLYFFQKFNPFVSSKLIFPDTPVFSFLQKKAGINRIWGYGAANIEANINSFYSLFSPDGYDPLYPKIYGEFVQASSNGRIIKNFNDRNRSDAVIAPGYGEKNLSANLYRLKILDLLGVKYILDKKENASTQTTFPADRFKLIYEKDDFKVYENIHALPRIFLTDDYKIFKNSEEFQDIFFSKNFDPVKMLLLEEAPANYFSLNKNGESVNKADVDLISYRPDKILLRADVSVNKLLFLSDTFYPGWRAYVDNNEVKIYKADYAFKAVVIPRGKHNVVFAYYPGSLYNGLRFTIISFVVLVLFSFALVKYKNFYEKN